MQSQLEKKNGTSANSTISRISDARSLRFVAHALCSMYVLLSCILSCKSFKSLSSFFLLLFSLLLSLLPLLLFVRFSDLFYLFFVGSKILLLLLLVSRQLLLTTTAAVIAAAATAAVVSLARSLMWLHEEIIFLIIWCVSN